MKTERQEDLTARAVVALKAAYDGTSLPDDAKRRIEGAVFATRSRRPGPWQLAAAFGLAAALAALITAWVFSTLQDEDAPEGGGAVRYSAVVLALTGDADVTLGRGATALPAAARMRLDGESTIATSPLSEAVLRIGPHEVTVTGDTRFDLASLDRGLLRFGIGRGRAHFDVAHLAPTERLAVSAGELIVEVVGTRFDVFFEGGCPAISVDEGKIRASFREEISILSAGSSRRFCAAADAEAAPRAPTARPDSPDETGEAARAERPARGGTGAGDTETQASLPAPATDTGATDGVSRSEEERLYLEALQSRVSGDLTLAAAQMADYLEKYPDGAFAEEALFSLVRLEYRRRAFGEVQRWGAAYLERHPGRCAKSDEVRILYAESLHRLGVHPGIAVETLAPLVRDVDSVAGPYREQALYLYFAAAADTGRMSEAKRAAASYLERYPGGQYAGAAKALVEGE